MSVLREKSRNQANLSNEVSGKRRENVGNDSGCMSGKACRYDPGISTHDGCKRAVGTTEHSESARVRVSAASGGRKEGYWEVIHEGA